MIDNKIYLEISQYIQTIDQSRTIKKEQTNIHKYTDDEQHQDQFGSRGQNSKEGGVDSVNKGGGVTPNSRI